MEEKNNEHHRNKSNIDFNDITSRNYWTALWGINERQLKEALEASGSSNADEIERILRVKKYI